MSIIVVLQQTAQPLAPSAISVGGSFLPKRRFDSPRLVRHPNLQCRYNAFMDTTNEIRADALTQLKRAQHMIEEGRKELAAALDKIRDAQELIDQSAEMLRASPPHHAVHLIGAAKKPK